MNYLEEQAARVVLEERKCPLTAGNQIEMPLKKQMLMLSTAQILEPLSEEELEKLADRCPDICYRQGKIISTPDDPAHDAFYIIKKGRVRVYELGPEGREHTIAEITGGTTFAARRVSGVYTQALEETIVVVL